MSAPMPGKLSDVALRTSLLYALVAAVWILISDKVLAALVPDPQIMGEYEVCKGWAFVLVTALLLFGALRGQLRRWEQEAAARRRTEAYLAEAQRLSHTGSFGWNVATDEHFWSEETFRIFEYEAGTKIALPLVLERVHPNDRTLVRETLECAAQERKDLDYEHRLLMPDGSVKHLHVVARCVGHESGNVEFIGAVTDETAQRQADVALRRSEAYLAEAQTMTHTGSWAHDGTTRRTSHWSYETFRMWGFDPKQGLPTFDEIVQRIHPQDRHKHEEASKRAFLEKVAVDCEHRIVLPDATVKHVYTLAHPVLSPAGELLEVVGTTVDITERKRAEEALQRSEAYLADAQKLTHTGSKAWRVATNQIIHWSDECFRTFGFEPQRSLPSWEEWEQRVHPEDRDKRHQRIEQAVSQKAGYELDYRIILPDGRLRHIHSVNHPVFGPAGEVVEFLGTAMDVTERKEAEEALRRSEAFLAEGQRISQTGSWLWNPATGEMTSSKERLRIFGLETEKTAPSFDVFLERVHPEDKPRFKQTLDSAIREKRDFEDEYRIVTPDGIVKHIHSVSHAVVSESGELVEFIGTTMDITDRKRAEQALQEAQSELARVTRVTMLGELAASIAHEVNQPLAGVVTSASAGLNWLAKDPPNLLKTREAIERILRDGTRAGKVLNRIRTLLKRTPPNKSRASLNQIVGEVVALAGGELRQNNVELSVELDSELPAIVGDNIQLQQVLLNLIMNAVEAMASNANRRKILRICSESDDLDGKPAVSVKVSDTGIGLSGADASRLFEAFHTTKPEGMGMGLWISRSIIESHRGRLTAQSNDGPGATFQVLLPAETGGSE